MIENSQPFKAKKGLDVTGASTFNGSATFQTNDFIKLPAGSTAQRPSVPVPGMLRHNTDTDHTEVYSDGRWYDLDYKYIWSTVSSSTYTFEALVTSIGLSLDTTSTSITVTLPTAPISGDRIALVDAKGMFASNNATINPGSAKINGATGNLVLNMNGQFVTLSWSGDSNIGWIASGVDFAKWINSFTTPTIRPNLLLDFANSKTLDPRITFTRNSIGTRVNSRGLVETMAANKPRFSNDPISGLSKGLLIEESRINLATYSDMLDNSIWSKSGATTIPRLTISPDGAVTATKLVEDTSASTNHRMGGSFTVTTATAYTFSIFAKAAERSKFRIQYDTTSSTGGIYADVDLTAGTVGSVTTYGTGATSYGATITSFQNGWYRVSISMSHATQTGALPYIYLEATAGVTSYTGDGSSGLYLWGAQFEQGQFKTSYIPTTASFTSRASTATYYDATGTLQTAAINVARNGYDPTTLLSKGLILEAAATNLALYSEQADNAAWLKTRSIVTANATTAPDGNVTADKLVEDTSTSNSHYVYEQISVTSGTTYSISVFMKAAERTQGYIQFNTQFGANAWAYYDLSAGTVISNGSAATATIFKHPNGWYRCVISAPATSTATSNMLVATSVSSSNSYTGNGTSGIYVWGLQVEAGSYATSYIQTTSATVTRSADVSSSAAVTRQTDIAVLTGTSFSSWFKRDTGTIVSKTDINGIAQYYPRVFEINDGSTSNHIASVVNPSLVNYLEVTNAGSSVTPGYSRTVSVGTPFSTAMAYATNDLAVGFNGSSTIDTQTSATVPTPMVKMSLGSDINGYSNLNGHIYKLAFYPKRLSNAELQGVTQ